MTGIRPQMSTFIMGSTCPPTICSWIRGLVALTLMIGINCFVCAKVSNFSRALVFFRVCILPSADALGILCVACFCETQKDRRKGFYCPNLSPVGTSRPPTDKIERVSLCLPTVFVPVMIKVGGVMAWRFGKLTGMTMQSLGMAIRWQICKCEVMAGCCHGMVTGWYQGQPFSFQW